jgi:nitroimidazol reductase NimA-like FMN-containing flavoprotein (pyridoxamine 5'-phosphate oxidase superfamily)
VVPVNYNFDGEFALIHSLPGLKINAMRNRPRVCLQVDEIEGEFRWRSVLAFGVYEEIKSGEERARVINHLLKSFSQLTQVEAFIVEDAGAPSTSFALLA